MHTFQFQSTQPFYIMQFTKLVTFFLTFLRITSSCLIQKQKNRNYLTSKKYMRTHPIMLHNLYNQRYQRQPKYRRSQLDRNDEKSKREVTGKYERLVSNGDCFGHGCLHKSDFNQEMKNNDRTLNRLYLDFTPIV